MVYKEFHLQSKWFGDSTTPKNPKKATATLTFSDVVANGETVTIGAESYEFKTSGNATAGKIKVDISGEGDTASDKAAAKLVATIIANSSIVTAVADEDASEKDIVVIEYKTVGTEGNAITVATTCTNASFGVGVTKLSGGQYGTSCPVVDTIVYTSPYYYWCKKEGNSDNVAWERFIPASY